MKLGDNPELRRVASQMQGSSGRSTGPPRGQQRRRRGGARPQQQCQELPSELVFDTFYNEHGKLRPEIFFEKGRKLADLLQSCGVSGKQFRSIFMGYQAIAKALSSGRIDMPTAQERFGQFYTKQVVRQVQRNLDQFPPVLRDLFDKHLHLIRSDQREFIGFWRYLEAAFCYFRPEGS